MVGFCFLMPFDWIHLNNHLLIIFWAQALCWGLTSRKRYILCLCSIHSSVTLPCVRTKAIPLWLVNLIHWVFPMKLPFSRCTLAGISLLDLLFCTRFAEDPLVPEDPGAKTWAMAPPISALPFSLHAFMDTWPEVDHSNHLPLSF